MPRRPRPARRRAVALASTALALLGLAVPAVAAAATLPTPPKVAVWALDEGGTATTALDATAAAHTLRLSRGTTWTDGILAAYGHDPRDRGLLLDADTDRATTTRPVVDTRKPFAVAAVVRVDDHRVTRTVVSQLGTRAAALSLGVRKESACPAGTGGACFGVTMRTSDTYGTGAVAVRSPVPVVDGGWYFVVAQVSAARVLELVVMPLGTAAAPVLVPETVTRATAPAPAWAPTGAFVVGHGASTTTGAPSGHWRGVVSAARAYAGPLDVSMIRRLATNPYADPVVTPGG